MPKISILVPVYNVEKYLKQCLDSLINQTLEDVEIICINDGSTDSSKQIIDEYRFRDKRIKLINKVNTGYGDSMNKGLEAAKGDYIGIVEPDDFIEPCMYKELYNIALKHPEINLIKSDWYWYCGFKNQFRKAGKIKKEGVIDVFKYQKLLKYQSIWTCIYKRNYLIENNIKFLTTPGASYQDTSFAFKTLVSAKKVYLTKKAYLNYRTDNENSSVKSKEKVYFICNEHEEIAKFCENHPDIKKRVLTNQRINQYRAYKVNVIRIDEKFRDEFLIKFQKTFKTYLDENTIPNDFYKKVNKKEFNLLISNLDKYKKLIKAAEKNKNNREKRSKYFSFRINSSRISIVLFGKQIVEIG